MPTAVANPDALTTSAALKASLLESLAAAERYEAPYRHWALTKVLPDSTIDALLALPFAAQDVGGVSGERELHNDTRTYFDQANIDRYPVCGAVAAAFHDEEVVGAFARATGSQLDGTLLRFEYALDTTGFWLRPHTDLGVKRLTFLYYLARDGQEDLGTDVYAAEDKWVRRAPFRRNQALMFVPSDNTWHGFEQRPIPGVRRSIVMNYVTDAWRDRWQLAYADSPVRAASSARTA
ncbi:MAG TPA: 2OG-Fe(II) oxygenase [Caulobacteraceae bacterium]|nr:2OG-Fe(II) oxygenase [Caulobacteraceae bacterium]